MKKIFYILGILLLVVVGVGGGYMTGSHVGYKDSVAGLNTISPLREHDPNYKFIDPLLAYILPSSDQEEDLRVLKNKLSIFIDREKKRGAIDSASVFLSDLNGGRWIGIDENVKYDPASILKVVIMVVYFKEQETNSKILEKKLVYDTQLNSILKNNPSFSSSALEVGKSYTVDDLVKRMIVDSDNGAELLLLTNINRPLLRNLYTVLNIEDPETVVGNFTISPRSYSLFFRVLYSATYLSKDLSEKALGILSKTTFKEGIVAGLPKNTVVAHKFGQYNDSQFKSTELHDCGIVYYKTSPYFLCVMTKGGMVGDLKSVIKNISKLVYEGYASYK